MMPPDTVSLDFLSRQQAQLLEEIKGARAENREVRRTFTLISEHFARQERRFNELRDDFESMIKLEVGGAIVNLETRLGNEFEARLGAVERRIVAVEERQEKLEQGQAQLQGGLESMQGRLESMQGRLESMQGRLESMQGGLESMQGRLQSMQGGLESMQGVLESTQRGQADMTSKLDTILAAVKQA
ncbi:MAG: hypothetical protein ACOH2L_03760 [Devosia sp.]